MGSYFIDSLKVIRARLARAHKSMTIWVNTTVGMLVAGLPMLQAQLPQLQGYLPDNFYRYMMGLIVVANIILRFKTTQPMEDK